MAYVILERISGLEQLSETIASRYLKLVTDSASVPFTLTSIWMPLALRVISLFFSTLISILYDVQGRRQAASLLYSGFCS